MQFALFYEIPVPKPWGPDSEYDAYQNTIEEAVFADSLGWDAFWTVEHHFLQEYSHCSNPEVLYGAIAARTDEHAPGLRRAPHAPALQPPGPHRRVRRGPRPDLERSGGLRHRTIIDPPRARGLRGRPAVHPPAVGRGHRARRRLLDERRGRARRRVLEDAPASGPAEAPPEPAPADLRRHVLGGRAQAGGGAWDSGCARSPSGYHPRRWPRRSPSTRRPWRSAPNPSGHS